MDTASLSALATVGCAVAGVGGWLLSPWHRHMRAQRQRERDVADVVLGHEPRQGVPGNPGVLALLNALAGRLDDQDLTLARLDRRTASPLLNGKGERLFALIPTVDRLDRLTESLQETLTEHLELHTQVLHAKTSRRAADRRGDDGTS